MKVPSASAHPLRSRDVAPSTGAQPADPKPNRPRPPLPASRDCGEFSTHVAGADGRGVTWAAFEATLNHDPHSRPVDGPKVGLVFDGVESFAERKRAMSFPRHRPRAVGAFHSGVAVLTLT